MPAKPAPLKPECYVKGAFPPPSWRRTVNADRLPNMPLGTIIQFNFTDSIVTYEKKLDGWYLVECS